VTDPERDEEFEAYLHRRSVLSIRAQSDEKLEPPADLDAIVLRKARQAIHSPQQMPLYRAPRWALPVALAATVLLCISVALNVNTYQRPQITSRLVQATAPPSPEPREPAGAITAYAPRASSTASASPAPVMAPPAAAPAASASGPAPPLESEASTENPVVPAPTERAEVQTLNEVAVTAARKSADATQTSSHTDPKAWLTRIEALRAAGKNAKADAELRRFRAAFPSYEVPATLPTPSDPPK
jgi:hypothetical protein